jgi:hypothetical protein
MHQSGTVGLICKSKSLHPFKPPVITVSTDFLRKALNPHALAMESSDHFTLGDLQGLGGWEA